MTDQARNLRKRIKFSANQKQGKTIAVISGKGGVGKSNIALNFSLELLNRNKKVLIIDLDMGMGNINILLGVQPERTIVDLFNERLSIFDIMEKGPHNLHYIAGGSGLNDFIRLDEEKREFFYEQFKELVDSYDYIIFDMGAGISQDSIFFILAADECIVVTTTEPTAFTDAYSAIKQVVNHGGNMPIHVILNRARSKKDWVTLERFQRVVKQFLHRDIQPLGVIPEDRIVSEAVIKQTPYALLNEKAPASRSIRKLTDHFLSGTEDIPYHEEPAFIQRLKKLFRGKF